MNKKNNFLLYVKEASEEASWSKGVELARGSLPTDLGSQEKENYIFSLKDPKVQRTYKITLWPQEQDWGCDCKGAEDPCPHVIACSIILNKVLDGQIQLPKQETSSQGVVFYHLKRKEHGQLDFSRQIFLDQKTYPLSSSLSALLSGRIKGPQIAPTKDDLSLDCLLIQEKEGLLSPGVWQKIFPYLCQSSHVFLDDKPISLSQETVGLTIYGDDQKSFFEIIGKQDENILEIFKNGLTLCKDGKIRLLRQPKLSKEHWSWVTQGHSFGLSERNDFLCQILPKWNVPFLYQGKKPLPKMVNAPAQLKILTQIKNGLLEYQALIIYGNPVFAQIQGGSLKTFDPEKLPMRDLEKEKIIQDQFSFFLGHSFDESKNIDPDDWILFEEKILKLNSYTQERPSISFCEKDLDLGFESSSEGIFFRNNFDITSFRKALFQKKSFLRMMPHGEIQVIASQWIQKYGSILLELLESRSQNSKIPKQQESKALIFFNPEEKNKAQQDLEIKLSDQQIQQLFQPIKAHLRDYQKDGILWLEQKRKQTSGVILADDMGLGKTLQALSLFQKKTLVIAPTSLLNNWKEEINRFRPDLSALIYHGNQRTTHGNWDVLITSYGIVRMDLDILKNEFWDIITLDEAHGIKNPHSIVAQSVFQLQGKFKISLTGTPIENRLSDLWSQFAFIQPGYFPEHEEFLRRYEGRAEALPILAQTINPFIKRRLKSQVAKELPERTEKEIYVEFSQEERDIYNGLYLGSKASVVEKLSQGSGVMEAMELILRLRQAACHCGLLPGVKDPENFLSTKVSSLLEKLDELVTGGHKILVFSQWTSFLDLLEKRINLWKFLRLDGQTPIQERKNLVERFQKDPDISIFLLSLKAAGVGLNLTAADHVFIMDPWWNPTVEDQAADRSHRIGQDKPVFIHRFVVKDSIEENILLLQKQKKALAQGLLDGEALDQDRLTTKDILGLLS